MLKQSVQEDESHNKELQEDIQFLLSNIRARENGLIFFLERFTCEYGTPEEFAIFKEEFMQKEKIYAMQVSRIVGKHSQKKAVKIQPYIRTFWIKVKSIIKVSLDRLRILNLLNERIFVRYEEIIASINKNYDEQKGLEEFNSIENLLKRRNVDALIYGRNHYSIHNSAGKISKNRSESAFKQSKGSPKKHFQLPEGIKLEFEPTDKEVPETRLKSLNRYRRKKIMLENKVTKQSEKEYKKMMRSMEKYQRNLEGAMECCIDLGCEKKKSIKQNEEAMYDQLFKRNIPNHKAISKFLFGACGIANLAIKKSKMKQKKIIVRIESVKQAKESIKVNKSKAPRDKEKQARQRPQSSQTCQLKGFEDDKKRMLQTMFQDKKIKNKQKTHDRIGKYTKLIRLIS